MIFLALKITSRLIVRKTTIIAYVDLVCRMTQMEHPVNLVNDATEVFLYFKGFFFAAMQGLKRIEDLLPGLVVGQLWRKHFMIAASGGFSSSQ